ncbi:MAG: DUF4124 domain-containing protein [Desulfuromonadaceae bacterium]|nr:DUF4124 domain-containing protein [Desulfuromonadaceae bacterium]
MLQIAVILYTLACLVSVSSAEVYKWEDANGVHLTDNASSVPEKYREKVYAETSEQIKNTTPQTTGISKLNIPAVVNQINQVQVYQANLEQQQRRSTEVMRQQYARTQAANTKNMDNALQSMARFMAKWLLIGFILFIVWVATIIDIVRSEFVSPSNKTVWMLLVLFLPLLGMLLYYALGLPQKCNSMSYKEKQQEERLSRLRPKDPKDKDFVI